MSYGVGGNQEEQLFDSANGVGSGFTTKVPPGRIATADFAFEVAPDELDDLSLQITRTSTTRQRFVRGVGRLGHWLRAILAVGIPSPQEERRIHL